MSQDKYDKILGYAVDATEKVKRMLVKDQEKSKRINSEEGHDIKIDGDRISERIIIDFLRQKTNFNILSEETGFTGKRKESLYWIVDPIDGSLNFSRDIPISCISISLWDGNAPVLGVINDFNRGELFSGIVGTGAWLNGRKICVSNESRLEKSILASGFPSYTDYSNTALLGFVEKVQKFKKIRLIGSAALSTAYVACGRFDAYMEKDIMFWDIAAGIAITDAAGGNYILHKTKSEFKYNAVVSNSILSDKIQSLL